MGTISTLAPAPLAARAARRGLLRGRHVSLRTRLILLVLVGVLPLLGFSLVEEYLDYEAQVERTGRDTLATARTLTQAIDAELQARINVLQVLATSARLQSSDLDGFRARAETVVAQQYPGANIVVLKEDGSQLLNLAVPVGAPLPVRPHVETVRRVFATGRPDVSDLYFGAALQRPVISIDVPVKNPDGQVIAVLSMVPARETFEVLIRRLRLEPGWIVSVFDRQQVYIARSHGAEQYVGQKARGNFLPRPQDEAEGILDGVSREGMPVLAVFSRSEAFGWTITVGVPRAQLTGPAIAAMMRAMAFAATLLLVGLLLATLVARRISRPIGVLRTLAVAIEGNAALPSHGTGLPETDEVADALRVAQDHRRRNEQRFRTLFDSNPLAMCVYDLATLHVLEVNDSMLKLYGWSRAEFLAMRLPELWPPEAQAQLTQQVAERRRGYFSLKQWRKDGSRFDAEAVVRIIELDGRRVGMSTCQDITVRKAMEEQLRQSQKMETFGQLAGGVAHDFNNSLAVVVGSVEFILDMEADGTEIHAAAETAMHATQQAAALTRRLLDFSRRQDLAPVELDVAAVVEAVRKILRSAVSRAIELVVRTAPGSWRAILDRTQLETAVMNLVVNARDAIDRTGTIHVDVEGRVIGEKEAAASADLRAGNWIVVAVSDDGRGMTADIRARIFEPFFTTKEIGKGTGLGLSQIHSLVSQSGGFITVESTPGVGTRIALHFPAKS